MSFKRYGKVIAVPCFNRETFKYDSIYSPCIYRTMEKLDYPSTFKDECLLHGGDYKTYNQAARKLLVLLAINKMITFKYMPVCKNEWLYIMFLLQCSELEARNIGRS